MCSIIATGVLFPQIVPNDSASVNVPLDEFKHIIKVNILKNSCDSIVAERNAQLKLYEGVVANKDSVIQYERKTSGIWKKLYEDEQPTTWDIIEKYGSKLVILLLLIKLL